MASGLKERPREVTGRPSCWSGPWSLKADGRVGDSTLVSEWLTTRLSIHTGDCHAARTPGLACGPWTQAGHLPCGAGLSTPLPQAVSATCRPNRHRRPAQRGQHIPLGRVRLLGQYHGGPKDAIFPGHSVHPGEGGLSEPDCEKT